MVVVLVALLAPGQRLRKSTRWFEEEQCGSFCVSCLCTVLCFCNAFRVEFIKCFKLM